ncbi:BspA family leucine-rich repeat surface protein [Lactobacillus sp.]|uniref:mucin-binding protein n=1 Tax=Lactobacillus sp. TaxID=1591 RepID=UPI0025F07320|nr:BspA family leucine-rich repeat surface protein [Lactobacillus sp.]MCO6533815.1 BspA family leucine-rich repeat surface protein [Lactobacillus sp.]
MKNNKKKGLIVSSTVVGLVCGLALTQQQAKAATVDSANEQSSTVNTTQNISSSDTNNNQPTSDAHQDNIQSAANEKQNTPSGADNNVNDSVNQITKTQNVATKAAEPEMINQGTWGTCKWEYQHDGDDYVLHIHKGTLEVNRFSSAEIIDTEIDHQIIDSKITKIIIDPTVTVAANSGPSLFSDLTHLKTIEGLTNLDTSQMTNTEAMFSNCSSLTEIDLSHFDTSNVYTMASMFEGCTNLTSVTNLDISAASFVPNMFQNCSSLTTLTLAGSKYSVREMQSMFSGCTSLVNLDLSAVNSDNTSAISMFQDCTKLASLDIRQLKIGNGSHIFENCVSLNHLVLAPVTESRSYQGWSLPNVPAVGTPVPGTNKKVTAPYWAATSGFDQGKQYTSEELGNIGVHDQVTTYDWVAVVPVVENSTESKAVSRLINIHQPDGTVKSDTQTAIINRTVTVYDDGSVDYGKWSSSQWDAYQIPVFAGYGANLEEIPAGIVNGQTVDQTVDVYYTPVKHIITIQYIDSGKVVATQEVAGYPGNKVMPDYQIPNGYEVISPLPTTITVNKSGKQIIKVPLRHQLNKTSELKTLTRTINIHQPNGSVQTYSQVAVLNRPVTEDRVTGQKIYGAWNTARWSKFVVPTLTGYIPSSANVAAKAVTSASKNERIDIYYKKAK